MSYGLVTDRYVSISHHNYQKVRLDIIKIIRHTRANIESPHHPYLSILESSATL